MKKNKKLLFNIMFWALDIIGLIIMFMYPVAKIQLIGLFIILSSNIINLLNPNRK